MSGRVDVGDGQWLSPTAAASYARMRADGMPGGITSAGRTPDEQAGLFLANYVRRAWNPLRPAWSRGPFADVRWWRGHRYVRVTPVQAAPPGASYSRHESGLALDLPDTGPRTWIRDNGARHGWFATVPGEPWHYEHDLPRDQFRHTTPPTALPPLTPPPPARPVHEEDDMQRIIEALYRRHLGRTPGNSEVDNWLDQYAAGMTVQAIRNAIYGSPEAVKRRAV